MTGRSSLKQKKFGFGFRHMEIEIKKKSTTKGVKFVFSLLLWVLFFLTRYFQIHISRLDKYFTVPFQCFFFLLFYDLENINCNILRFQACVSVCVCAPVYRWWRIVN